MRMGALLVVSPGTVVLRDAAARQRQLHRCGDLRDLRRAGRQQRLDRAREATYHDEDQPAVPQHRTVVHSANGQRCRLFDRRLGRAANRKRLFAIRSDEQPLRDTAQLQPRQDVRTRLR